ncbi:uncharacterized protein LOC144866369 [Branchiostoma floridae x Branchiostoma japonicum]
MGIGKKEDSILEDAQEADVVFSLGNKTFDHFQNQFRAIPTSKRPQHFKFVPKPSKIFVDAEAEFQDTETLVVLSIGRVKGAEKLKGYDLAIESLSIVADKMKVKYRVIGVDKDDFEARQALLDYCKSANLHITFLPYGTQKDIYKEMMQAHLVLMTSRAEPFGLVGLEAIAAGVPVLVSSRSGLADFIHEHVDELHHSIVDMDGSEDGTIVKYLARSIERVLKHNSTEFETAARCRQKLLASKYWEESHQQFIKACKDAAGSLTLQPDEIQTRKRSADDTGETFGGRKRPKPEIPPLLPIVVEILAQVKPSVKTPKQLLSYASARKELISLDITRVTDETLGLLEQVKPEIKTMEDLLDTTEAIKQLEEFKGVNVANVKIGSLVFNLQCAALYGLGELWFMYRRGGLNNLLHSSLIKEDAVQHLGAESISVKATINIEDFRTALVYLLTSPAAKGPSMKLPQEYPLHQPHTHTAGSVLDILHLDYEKLPEVCGQEHLQEMQLPAQLQGDEEDDLVDKLGNFQIAATTLEGTLEDREVQEINSVLTPAGASVIPDYHNQQAAEALDDNPELPQMTSDLVSLDIRELERLMGSRRKRSSSMSSESSGYVTGTPGSGSSRPDSPTGEGDTQNTLENLLAALNTPAVMEDKAQQFDLYCQIGDLYRTKLHNLQSALQYYQYMLECSQELPEDIRRVVAYSRLGLTCDILGLQEEASHNHEMALRAINRLVSSKPMREIICVAYKNLASSLALSGHVSDAKANYERAMGVAMETGNKTEQMAIFCMLGDLHREQLHSPQTAIQYYEQCLTLARQMKDQREEGLTYNRLGVTHNDMGEYEAALKWNLKYLKIVQQVGDKKEQTAAHICLGDTYRFLGELDQATSHLNTALQIAQQTGDQHGQMKVYFEMGEMHMDQLHSPHTAIQYYEQSLTLARQLKDKREEGLAYNRLGLSHRDMGEYEAVGDKKKQTAAHISVGDTYRLLGKLDQATFHFNTALQVAQQTWDQHGQMDVYCKMGDMQREQLHSPRTAIQYYEKALDIARQLNDKNQEEVAYDRLGWTHFSIGEHEAGLKWFQKALKLRANEDSGKQGTTHSSTYPKPMHQHKRTSTMVQQMKICFKTGETQREQLHSPRTAIQFYEHSLAVARQLGERHEQGRAYDRLGRVHFEIKEYEKALDSYQKYLTMKEEESDKQAQIAAHKNIAKSYKKLEHKDLAKSHYQSAMKLAMEIGDKQQQGDIRKKIAKL